MQNNKNNNLKKAIEGATKRKKKKIFCPRDIIQKWVNAKNFKFGNYVGSP